MPLEGLLEAPGRSLGVSWKPLGSFFGALWAVLATSWALCRLTSRQEFAKDPQEGPGRPREKRYEDVPNKPYIITFSMRLLNLFCKPSRLRFWPSWLPFWAGGLPDTASMATKKAQDCPGESHKRVSLTSPMLQFVAALLTLFSGRLGSDSGLGSPQTWPAQPPRRPMEK